jgi:glutathione S-transferase
MALTFYAASGSPFAWKVWLALEHKKLAYELKVLSLGAGDLRKPEYAAVNPRMKVPAIVVDGGFSLYESSAIVEYLEERYPEGPSLLPKDVQRRALVRRIAAETDGYLHPAAQRVYKHTSPKRDGESDPKELAGAKGELGLELERVERVMTDGWLVDAPSIAEYALYPMLAGVRRLGEKLPQHSMSSQFGPRTRAWMSRVEALPYFDACYPPHWRAGEPSRADASATARD